MVQRSHRWLAAIGCALSLAALPVGCASGGKGCGSDLDCKGDRICIAGHCQNPDGTPGAGGAIGDDGNTSTTHDPNDPSCEDSTDCDGYLDGHGVCVVGETMKTCQALGEDCDSSADEPCSQSAADCYGGEIDQRGECLEDAPSLSGVGCVGPEDCESDAFCVENEIFDGYCFRPGH